MINDLLKLTIDCVFLPKKGQTSYDQTEINIFDVPGYDINENMWQFLIQLLIPVANSAKTVATHKIVQVEESKL